MSAGGLGQFSTIDLTRVLAGSSTGVQADIGDVEEGLRGGASRKDVEKMFQLIYLRFTAPRADPEQFEAMKARLLPLLENQSARPEVAFRDALVSALTQNHPRERPLSPASVAQMSLDRSMAFYKSRFADASDFTFVFVGSFDCRRHEAAGRALPGQPAGAPSGRSGGRPRRPPAGRRRRAARSSSGLDPRSQVAIVFSGPFQNDPVHRLLIKTMGQMLAGNLQQTLREDLGGTYGVSVEPHFSKFPTARVSDRRRLQLRSGARGGSHRGGLEGDPGVRRRRAVGLVKLAGARNALERELEVGFQENTELLDELMTAVENGEDIADVFNPRPLYDQLTTTALRDAAREYLNPRRYVQVTLRPETKQ